MSENAFFPARDKREIRSFVTDHFPFPVAVTYSRLQQWMDDQEPVSAAWQLRDAFECLLKFCASLAVADFLETRTDADNDDVEKLVKLLVRPGGLSMGGWHSLLEIALSAGDRQHRKLPDMYGVFFKPNGKRSTLNTFFQGSEGSFVNWRNQVFGHGVFKQEPSWYAEQVNEWLPKLHSFYDALQPVWEGWSLRGATPDEENVSWNGAAEVSPAQSHQHQAQAAPLPMLFTKNDVELLLGPMLSVQRCDNCLQQAVFFFDRNRYDRKNERHSTHFLEYFMGHSKDEKNWGEVSSLYQLLPPNFEWIRDTWDSQEITDGQKLLFRDFEEEYQRPDYLFDHFWEIVEREQQGYIHLIASAGVGKSYFVRGLENCKERSGTPVLAYYIRSGALTNYQTFVSELGGIAREKLRFRTQEVQTRGNQHEDLREQFAEFIAALMKANTLETLVIAIDGLDELTDPAPNSAAITSLLPQPEKLPKGCFVLLTSREHLSPQISKDVKRLRTPKKAFFTPWEVSADGPDNQEVLRAYLRKNLPETLRSEQSIEDALKRSEGVFLHAFHFCRALATGAFVDINDLPSEEAFYPTYLQRLCERVGEPLFYTIYLPTLMLLAAAQQPITLGQLHNWGIPRERLRFALLDLGSFLREHRKENSSESLCEGEEEEEVNRYEIAHETFKQYVQNDSKLADELREAHAIICNHAWSKYQKKWEEMDVEDDADLYDLRWLRTHRELASIEEPNDGLLEDDGFSESCSDIADRLSDKDMHHLSITLFDQVIDIRRGLIGGGRTELAGRLAYVLWVLGGVLSEAKKTHAALRHFDEAIEVLRRLERDNGGESEALAYVLEERGCELFNSSVGVRRCETEEIRAAIESFDEAIEILRRLERENGGEFAKELARVLIAKGEVLLAIGEVLAAIKIFDVALDIDWQSAAERVGRVVSHSLSIFIQPSGGELRSVGEARAAIPVCDETIKFLRRLERESGGEFAEGLARVLMAKGDVLRDAEEPRAAINSYDEAIGILQWLRSEGGTRTADYLAKALVDRWLALRAAGELRAATESYEEIIEILPRLIYECGEELARKSSEDRLTDAIVHGKKYERVGNVEAISNELIRVLENNRQTLRDAGELRAVIESCDEAIEILQRLIRENREGKTSEGHIISLGRVGAIFDALVRALEIKRRTLRDAGELRAVIEGCGEAIEILQRLIRENRCGRLNGETISDELIRTLEDKRLALRDAGELRAVIESCDEAIEILRRRIREDNRWYPVSTEIFDGLIRALEDKRLALRDAGELRAMIGGCDEAIEILRWLESGIERHIWGGDKKLPEELVRALLERGDVLCDAGELRAALENYEEANEILRRQVSTFEEELPRRLAGVLLSKGYGLRDTGTLLATIRNCGETINTCQQQVRDGRVEFANDLGRALRNQKDALHLLRQSYATVSFARRSFAELRDDDEDAIHLLRAKIRGEDSEEAFELCRRLVSEDRMEFAGDLANALIRKGRILYNDEKNSQAAIECYDEAIEISRRLEHENEGESAGSLIGALASKGRFLLHVGDFQSAIESFGEAIELLRRLGDTDGLAIVLTNQADALRGVGDFQAALENYVEALNLLRAWDDEERYHYPTCLPLTLIWTSPVKLDTQLRDFCSYCTGLK